MKDIPKKNYAILMLLLVITVLVTLYIFKSYSNRNRELSNMYKYLDVITYKDFNVYITENPDIILYVGNKYDLNYEDFNTKLINKIEKSGLKYKFVYMNVNNKIINEINKEYRVKLSISNVPYLISFLEGKIIKYSEIKEDSEVSTIINLKEFK